jgi:hypothetical protein
VATVAAFYRAFSPLVCSFSLSVLKRVFNLCALLSSFGARGDGGKETGIDGEWVEQSCGPHVQLQRSVGASRPLQVGRATDHTFVLGVLVPCSKFLLALHAILF